MIAIALLEDKKIFSLWLVHIGDFSEASDFMGSEAILLGTIVLFTLVIFPSDLNEARIFVYMS